MRKDILFNLFLTDSQHVRAKKMELVHPIPPSGLRIIQKLKLVCTLDLGLNIAISCGEHLAFSHVSVQQVNPKSDIFSTGVVMSALAQNLLRTLGRCSFFF